MDFIDQLKQFSKRVANMKDTVQTEEATKTSLIMPFFSLLGYDVFNPNEFVPEFTADVGIKKGEKVDYAIMNTDDNTPVILIEAKWVGETLDKHDSQLFRYFGTTQAKFAILTNGVIYRFYTDLEESNKMDSSPFLEVDLLNIKDSQVPELKKFQKSNFNVEDIFDTASQLKYSNEFKNVFSELLQNPSEELVRIFLSSVYPGVKTQAVIEKFRPILKKSLNDYINEFMNEKIKTALNVNNEISESKPLSDPEPQESKEISESDSSESSNKINTTSEELGGYFIVKMILKDVVPLDDIFYKDTINYFGILYKNKTTKWICRLILSNTRKVLIVPDENKKEVRFPIDNIYEIEKYKDLLIEAVQRYL